MWSGIVCFWGENRLARSSIRGYPEREKPSVQWGEALPWEARNRLDASACDTYYGNLVPVILRVFGNLLTPIMHNLRGTRVLEYCIKITVHDDPHWLGCLRVSHKEIPAMFSPPKKWKSGGLEHFGSLGPFWQSAGP